MSFPTTITRKIASAAAPPPARSPRNPTWLFRNVDAGTAATSAPSVIDHCEPMTLPASVAVNVVRSGVSRGR